MDKNTKVLSFPLIESEIKEFAKKGYPEIVKVGKVKLKRSGKYGFYKTASTYPEAQQTMLVLNGCIYGYDVNLTSDPLQDLRTESNDEASDTNREIVVEMMSLPSYRKDDITMRHYTLALAAYRLINEIRQ